MTVGDVYKSLLSLNADLMEPLWHINWGAWIRGRFHGPLTIALLNAPDLETGLSTAARYFPARLPYLKFDVKTDGDRFTIAIEALQAPEKIRLELIEVPLYLTFDYIRSFVTLDMSEAMVFLERANSPHASAYRQWFRGSVEFGAGKTQLSIPKSWISIPNPERDPSAWSSAMAKCEVLASKPKNVREVVQYVRRALRAGAQSGSSITELPKMNELANDLHISVRTMIRHLEQQATSYRQIIDDIQKARATELLQVSEMKISEISNRLGYSDAANFGRAFRRWFGVSPGQYRRTLGCRGNRRSTSKY